MDLDQALARPAVIPYNEAMTAQWYIIGLFVLALTLIGIGVALLVEEAAVAFFFAGGAIIMLLADAVTESRPKGDRRAKVDRG